MDFVVVSGAMCLCTGGVAPSTLIAISPILVCNRPVLTILDYIPMLNVMPFGVCTVSLGMPCIPTTPAPWIPMKPNVIAGKAPVLLMQSKLICARGGVINIIFPGQVQVTA